MACHPTHIKIQEETEVDAQVVNLVRYGNKLQEAQPLIHQCGNDGVEQCSGRGAFGGGGGGHSSSSASASASATSGCLLI